jgi:hypothetical protein
MAGDRARVSHDPSRDYRAVVLQQGRVTLEADGNEASRIFEDGLRADVIDIVGPYGTPDDGYKVSAAGAGFLIGPGSYYLGGWRVQLAREMPLAPGPDALDLAAPTLAAGNYAIALLLTEQEVSAVEDRALLEVALGGPDTCQRTRLMQSGVAIRVRGDDCSSAEQGLDAALLSQGAEHDHATGMLKPTARLQVHVVSPPVPADPCDPPASGGYLGADNQLIRLAVVSYNLSRRRGRLVWGFDNSSTLYRASTTDGQVLTLEGDPIDSDHAPRMGQAVEVLQTRKRFDHGDVVAADSGLVTKVAQPYNSDLRTVQLAATLAAESRGDADHPLFLRLWQSEIPFENESPVDLGDTGLAVTLSLTAALTAALTAPPGPVVARPFWTFAARPSTPVMIYPRRCLDGPQPPEGPRQWLAPLAVAMVAGRGATVLDDCRDTFLPLTKLKPGCCGVMLDADMHGRRDFIQRALDRLRGTRGTVTLRPGHYRLHKPIRMDASHKGLTLEGCGEGVFLEAADENDPAFAQGLVILDDVNEVTLRSLQLQMPVAELGSQSVPGLTPPRGRGGMGSIGISAAGCAQLTITECQIRFRIREYQRIVAIGFLARGECWGLRLTRNRFLHDVDYEQSPEALRLLFGYALVPAIRIGPSVPTLRQLSEASLDALLDDAEISDNQFVGMTIAVLASARLGYVRIERNRVKGCSGGIYLLESALGAGLRAVRQDSRDPDRVQLVPIRELAAAMSFAATGTAVPHSPAFANASLQTEIRRAKARSRTYLNLLSNDVDAASESTEAPPRTAGAESVQIDAFLRIAAAIDSRFDRLAPALHLHANDIDVFGTLAHERTADPAGRSGEPVFGALHVVVELRQGQVIEAADFLVTSNRMAGLRSPSVRIIWPQRLVFGSNMVIGDPHAIGRNSGRDPALLILTHPRDARLEVMGNVVDAGYLILPNQRPEAPSQAWRFVNRTS